MINYEERKCAICGNKFIVKNGKEKGRISIYAKNGNRVTCNKECSKKYEKIWDSIYTTLYRNKKKIILKQKIYKPSKFKSHIKK